MNKLYGKCALQQTTLSGHVHMRFTFEYTSNGLFSLMVSYSWLTSRSAILKRSSMNFALSPRNVHCAMSSRVFLSSLSAGNLGRMKRPWTATSLPRTYCRASTTRVGFSVHETINGQSKEGRGWWATFEKICLLVCCRALCGIKWHTLLPSNCF